MQSAITFLDNPSQVTAVAHPIRRRILEALRSPDTAATVARSFGRSRQFVGYHVRELERLGLLERVGERRKGNFIEQLYQSTARRFVVAAGFAANPEQLAAVFRDQVSLAQLTELGERLQTDALQLIDAAANRGEEIPSVSIEADVGLPTPQARTAFMRDVSEALRAVLEKHGTEDGPRYRVAFATYPQEGKGSSQ